MHLYMFYLGGNAGKSNIEVHDIQFVSAERPDDAWPALRAAWFGDADKVHVDGYARILWADGYRITLSICLWLIAQRKQKRRAWRRF